MLGKPFNSFEIDYHNIIDNRYQISYTYSIKAKGAANGYGPGLYLNKLLFTDSSWA